MSTERGILTKEDERWLSRVGDATFTFKRKFWELADRFILLVLIRIVDDIFVDKYLPDSWVNPIQKIIDAGKIRNKVMIAAIIDEKIDLPFLGVWEAAIFTGIVNFIAGYVYAYLDGLDLAEADPSIDDVIDSVIPETETETETETE